MPKKEPINQTPAENATEPSITKPIRVRKSEPDQATKPIFKSTVDQPGESLPIDETPKKKVRHGKWVWLGILGMVVIAAVGAGVGYASAIRVRMLEDVTQRQVLATTQFEMGNQDVLNGNLDMARQRFEYVLTIYPQYPGIEGKLKEVMLTIALSQGSSNSQTPNASNSTQAAFTPVATTDTRSTSILLNQGQQQLAASDWLGLLKTVNTLREIDPAYEAVKVDGLYYFALRNNGITQIEAGNLEVGIYYFSMAEQLAPIDKDADSYRTWAELYLNAGSWWDNNWAKAVEGFSQLYDMGLSLQDSSHFTVKQRFARALEAYGDYLQATFAWCDAVPQYEKAMGIVLSQTLTDKLTQARELCANPPATPTPTLLPAEMNLTPTPTNAP